MRGLWPPALLLLTAAVHAQDGLLSLDQAIRLAVTRNERAAIADRRVEAARARVDRARAFFFPDLTVGADYTRRGDDSLRPVGEQANDLTADANIRQVIFDARAFPLFRQSRLLRDSALYFAAEEKRLLAFEAADAFITTLSLEQVAAAADRRRNFAQTNLNDARARFEAGLVSSNDVTRAALELATAERESARARGDVEIGYLQLGNLLNVEVQGPLEVPQELLAEATSPAAATEGTVEQARNRRLDVAASQRTAQAQRAFAEEPPRRFFPTLALNGNLESSNQEGLSGRQNDSTLALNLSWPVWDGGDRAADRAERLALARAAELDLALLERDVELEVRSSSVGVASEQASLRQAIAAVEAARKNAEETSALYREGLASALEVADASVQLFEAEVAEARARFQLTLAFLALRSATGLDPVGQEVTR